MKVKVVKADHEKFNLVPRVFSFSKTQETRLVSHGLSFLFAETLT